MPSIFTKEIKQHGYFQNKKTIILGFVSIIMVIVPYAFYTYPLNIHFNIIPVQPWVSLISIIIMATAFKFANYNIRITWWFLIFSPIAILQILFDIVLFIIC